MAEHPYPALSVRIDPDALVVSTADGERWLVRERWAWGRLAAWCRAAESASVPRGIHILLREAPGVRSLAHDTEGLTALIAMFGRLGVPELPVDQLMTLADRGQQAMAREKLSLLTPEARDEVEAIFAELGEVASGRVRLALLALAGSDLKHLRALAGEAKSDWRQVVAAADARGYRA